MFTGDECKGKACEISVSGPSDQRSTLLSCEVIKSGYIPRKANVVHSYLGMKVIKIQNNYPCFVPEAGTSISPDTLISTSAILLLKCKNQEKL